MPRERGIPHPAGSHKEHQFLAGDRRRGGKDGPESLLCFPEEKQGRAGKCSTPHLNNVGGLFQLCMVMLSSCLIHCPELIWGREILAWCELDERSGWEHGFRVDWFVYIKKACFQGRWLLSYELASAGRSSQSLPGQVGL